MRFTLPSRVLLVLFASLAAGENEVTVERNVPVKMRDGVVLHADIYRPKAKGKFPVLLQRTPYNKNGKVEFGLKAAARGYVTIIQDVRGRFSSEGEWYTFKHESDDGYDTVEWAAALPYSNGKVGMFGSSYVGATQMLAAMARPPHLAGIFPVVTASNYHDGWTYQGGAFEQWFSESWTSGLAQNTFRRHVEENTTAFFRSLIALLGTEKLPFSSYPVLEPGMGGELAPYFLDWLQHPTYDDYWRAWSIEDHFAQIQVPAYHMGGWYDIFMGGTLRNYAGIKARGGSESARRNQRLMIGPWYHGPFTGKTGDVDFGREANLEQARDDITLRWYDSLLKGIQNGVEKEKPVKIFLMGKNIWREEDDWPLARAKSTRFYLHSGGKANTLAGDGTLSVTPAQAETKDSFVYDPADPVPTRGGGLCCDNQHLASGAFDQRHNEARSDVLVYTTPVLKEDMEVTGPISVELYASSSTVDTDFTAKLVDVRPDGYAQNLTDGILRARYRNSQEKPKLMQPGNVYKFNIDLWATSNVFLAGHHLRLEISSSNFPRFDRNLNTADDPERGARWVKATNTIYHDREHPSALILPVINR